MRSSRALRRFIPAGAGNAPARRGPLGTSDRFIPAGAGNAAYRMLSPPWAGSSPRARGTLGRLWPPAPGRPVHPRGRGERSLLRMGRIAGPVHPRGRGERSPFRGPAAIACHHRFIPAGAGNAVPMRHCRRRLRFIPAGAGNASARSGDDVTSGSSPRARGTRPRSPCRAERSGSSPRVRGTRCQPSWCILSDRFIPAGAGNALAFAAVAASRTVHPRGCGERRRRGCEATR